MPSKKLEIEDPTTEEGLVSSRSKRDRSARTRNGRIEYYNFENEEDEIKLKTGRGRLVSPLQSTVSANEIAY